MKLRSMHEPVLVGEVIDLLHIQNQAYYIDATVGAGGHSCEIIKRGGRVLGIDADESMLKLANEKLTACPSPDSVGGSFTLVHGNFSQIAHIANENGFAQVDGILIDLGISNVHFSDAQRGFSFSDPTAELDMRLDPQMQQVKASDLLNSLREDQLIDLFSKVLKFTESRQFAKKVVTARNEKPFETVGDLLMICEDTKKGKTHPATRPFLALRMAVNSEMENIEMVIPQCMDLLRKGGRLAIITFHSTEDNLVKNIFDKLEKEQKAKVTTPEPIVPTNEEVEKNKKARSARLRGIEKL